MLDVPTTRLPVTTIHTITQYYPKSDCLVLPAPMLYNTHEN